MYSLFSRRSMATLLFVVFSFSIAPAQEKSNRLTPSDIFNLESPQTRRSLPMAGGSSTCASSRTS